MGSLPRDAGHHDALTGLPHRVAFEERLASEAARVRRYEDDVALCLLDLDRLGHVNETRGHSIGDEVVRTVAAHLNDLRGEDGVYRTGGVEFALILVGADEAGAGLAVERIRRALVTDPTCRGICISAGIARVTADPTSTLALAGAKLYAAKALRR